jgi:hypothetical protein
LVGTNFKIVESCFWSNYKIKNKTKLLKILKLYKMLKFLNLLKLLNLLQLIKKCIIENLNYNLNKKIDEEFEQKCLNEEKGVKTENFGFNLNIEDQNERWLQFYEVRSRMDGWMDVKTVVRIA